jgi:predicted DNA-binding protein
MPTMGASRVLYLRVPTEVKDRIDKIAEESGATINAVAIRILERGLGIKSSSIDEALDRHA